MAKNKKFEVMISATGFITSFVCDLLAKVDELGGTAEDIHRLVTPNGKELLTNIAQLIVDEGKPRFSLENPSFSSFEEMLEDANLDYVSKEFTQDHFPLTGLAILSKEIHLVRMGCYVSDPNEVIKRMDELGLQPATATHALIFAKQHPQEQLARAITFFGTEWDCGQHNYGFANLAWNNDKAHERALFVDYTCDGWGSANWFAAVPK